LRASYPGSAVRTIDRRVRHRSTVGSQRVIFRGDFAPKRLHTPAVGADADAHVRSPMPPARKALTRWALEEEAPLGDDD
jgi:hypothetical protein